jgi:hypothetical protein
VGKWWAVLHKAIELSASIQEIYFLVGQILSSGELCLMEFGWLISSLVGWLVDWLVG